MRCCRWSAQIRGPCSGAGERRDEGGEGGVGGGGGWSDERWEGGRGMVVGRKGGREAGLALASHG